MTRNTGTVTFAGITLAAVLLPLATVYAAQLPPLPPMPTEEAAAPPKAPPQGAHIELHVPFPESLSYPWQELWTVVQWQDGEGHWHNVEGWQGNLDGIENDEGVKRWWVDEANLGEKGFRWVVYRSAGGPVLIISNEFHMPDIVNQTQTVKATLAE